MQRVLARFTHLPPIIIAALGIVSVSAQTSLIQQGRSAVQRGESAAAIEILEKAVAQNPQSAEAHFALGLAYGSKGQQSGLLAAAKYGPKAKAEFERTIALDPKHVEARFGLVQFYAIAPGFIGGSAEKALEQAKELKAIDPLVG